MLELPQRWLEELRAVLVLSLFRIPLNLLLVMGETHRLVLAQGLD